MKTPAEYVQMAPKRSLKLWVISIILWLITAGLVWQSYQLDGANKAVEQSQIRQQIALTKPVPPPTLPPPWLAEVQGELSYPWHLTLSAIEQTARKDIQLLQFSPDKKNGTLLLRGEARTAQALMVFLEDLAKQKSLVRVHLLNQELLLRDQLETVGFEISANLES